jgi:hypothetical protein
MTTRELLGWAACLALGGGVIRLALLPLLVLPAYFLQVGDPAAVLAYSLAGSAILAAVVGVAAGNTRPGKVVAVGAGMMLFALLLLTLFSVSGGFVVISLDSTLGSSAVAAVLAMAGGTASWRTRPGKVAVIGSLLLVIATVVVVGGLLYHMMSMD